LESGEMKKEEWKERIRKEGRENGKRREECTGEYEWRE